MEILTGMRLYRVGLPTVRVLKPKAPRRVALRVAALSRRRISRQRIRAQDREICIPEHRGATGGELPNLGAEQEAMFNDALSQTLYVEKDAEMNNAVPVEVVPDSPSFSLVRTPKPIDKRYQNRRILGEVIPSDGQLNENWV